MMEQSTSELHESLDMVMVMYERPLLAARESRCLGVVRARSLSEGVG
jgi:hypothetical protein